jgi:hypothetical protein
MRVHGLKVLLSSLMVVGLANICCGQERKSYPGSSLKQVLENARTRPVHIFYIHGIAAQAAGDSLVFRQSLCGFLKHCTNAPGEKKSRDYADSGDFLANAPPPQFQYMGGPVWTSESGWNASAPFVDHYVLLRSAGAPIVVDEINWWPLAFPIKCEKILKGEAYLSGPDKALLELCSNYGKEAAPDPTAQGRFVPYPWITRDEARTLESRKSHAALFNHSLKTGLLDWGFADAIMAVGPMQGLFREAMRELFLKSAKFHADGSKTSEWEGRFRENSADREFVVVSHSLGSFLVFSTLEDNGSANRDGAGTQTMPQEAASREIVTQRNAARYIMERTSLIYFFANQIPLLELATMQRTENGRLPEAGAAAKENEGSTFALSAQIREWSKLERKFGERRIFAFSDPSDLLTYEVPKIAGLEVENCHVRNTWWHWIFVWPPSAHGNYKNNKAVLRLMMGEKACPEAIDLGSSGSKSEE